MEVFELKNGMQLMKGKTCRIKTNLPIERIKWDGKQWKREKVEVFEAKFLRVEKSLFGIHGLKFEENENEYYSLIPRDNETVLEINLRPHLRS